MSLVQIIIIIIIMDGMMIDNQVLPIFHFTIDDDGDEDAKSLGLFSKMFLTLEFIQLEL